MANPAHFEAGPSALPRIVICTASVQASRPFPNDSGAAAARGDRLHKFLELCFKTGKTTADFPTDGEWAIYTQDDRDAVDRVIDYVRDLLLEYPGELIVEQSIDLGQYVPGMMGTADVVIVSGRTVIVVDAKFGRNPVSPHTPQLKAYAVGVLDLLDYFDFDDVILAIAQPATNSFESITTTPGELYEWALRVMVPKVTEALGPNPQYNPDPEACKYCRARGVCAARKAAHYDEVAAMLDNAIETGTDAKLIDADTLAKIVAKADAFSAYLDDVKGHAIRELCAGRPIPGMKLVEGVTRRKYADPARAMAELAGALIAKRPELTPAEAAAAVMVPSPIGISVAEKLVGKTNPVFAKITTRGTPKPILAPESDPRAAYHPAADVSDALDSIEI